MATQMFKKLTEFLTPPPFRRTPKPQPVPPSVEDTSLSSSLKPVLKQLLTAPTVQEPAARESLAEMKQLACEKGLYVTAFEIRDRLSMMPRADAEGKRYHKERGYVLAGDFIWSHIRSEIAAIENSADPVGPNIFRGYCSEMVECLLQGENVRRGVEIPVLVIDSLLSEAVARHGKSAVYLGLAVQALKATVELAQQRFGKQKTRLRHKPEANPEDDPVTPRPDTPHSVIDEAVLAYAERLEQQLEQIRHEFSRFDEESSGPVPKSLERLQRVLSIADGAEYLPFSALIKEEMGQLLEPSQPEDASRFFASAGERNDSQGDEERRLFFTKLSATRYKKAREQFLRAGDQERAAQVQSKIDGTTPPGKR